jgi:tetratricopeptide (TPR) repeat protein
MGTLKTLDALASLALERGELDDALKSYDTLAALREQAGQEGPAARASAGAAYALALRGSLADAEKRIARAKKTADDDPIAIPTIDLAQGVLAWARGNAQPALDHLDKCNVRFMTVAPTWSVHCLLLRGEIQAEVGDADTARTTFEAAKAAADKTGNVYLSATAELEMAQLDLDQETGDATVADRIVERATQLRLLAATHGANSLEARAAIMLANARLAQGNSQDAFEVISKLEKQDDLRLEVQHLIADALTRSALNDATANDVLASVKKIADKQGCVSLQFEARLAVAQTLPPDQAKSELEALARDAKDKGLGRIAKRAEILAQP